ncbi:MAG: hypothetical protein A3F68_02505 [Acidobacteria bacterium RIFCSPLOWO2_12_FULL_54_10]|nr:MAG: hypothetical protein A3F68_02505 [Acidobacteria bacterium RIFCSPLOWO2_12_FULL_54_10]
MPYENLLLETTESIALVTFQRPKVLNALNNKTLAELEDCLEKLRQDDSVRVVIFTGAGDRAFVAGADIGEFASHSQSQARDFSMCGQAVFNSIETLGKPTIAAINGYALGGGCEMALACSMRIATPSSRLGLPEVKLGIIPGYGGTQRLPRLVGKGVALEMILTGEPVTAEEALRVGLVNRIVPADDLIPVAKALAKKIIVNAPIAVHYCLEAVHQGLDETLDQGLLLESTLFGMTFATEDMREGVKAFIEKRPARFTGR